MNPARPLRNFTQDIGDGFDLFGTQGFTAAPIAFPRFGIPIRPMRSSPPRSALNFVRCVALSDRRLERALQETSVSDALSTRGEFLGRAAPPELVHITRQRARGSAFVYPSQPLGEPPNSFANFWGRTLDRFLKIHILLLADLRIHFAPGWSTDS